jgi:pantothenate kinase
LLGSSRFDLEPINSEFDEDFQIRFEDDEIEQFYLPLASHLIERSDGRPRFIAGIAGPPGSGKTSFTRLLARVIDHVLGVEKAAVHIGMDGWHYPNTYLVSHYEFADGIQKSLKEIKGEPQTFDLISFYTFIEAVRAGKMESYPIYSRKCHDVIPGAGRISPESRFFLCEGNYLHLDLSGWKDVANAFDVRIFIDAPVPVLRIALRKRHLRGGKDTRTIEKFIEDVDLKNAVLVQEKRLPADIEIIKMNEVRIGEIRYPNDRKHQSQPNVSLPTDTLAHGC